MSLPGLFSDLPGGSASGIGKFHNTPASLAEGHCSMDQYIPRIGPRIVELFEKVEDPTDPFALRDLYLGRVETEARGGDVAAPHSALWSGAKSRRSVGADEILHSRAGIRMIKELFNSFFRDDLYGRLRNDQTIILSSGAVCEETFGLPDAARSAIRYALDRNWYGYSDSRGRSSAREAVARFESARLGYDYDETNIALTIGATFAINAVADFLLTGRTTTQPVICAIPNYPPLVESVARRADTRLVPLSSSNGLIDVSPLIECLRPETPLVLLQTANNPTGAIVDENSLAQLIDRASPQTMVVLDECHEFLGPPIVRSRLRAKSNVIRISSISKTWSAPGIKAGWLIADSAIIDDYYEFASTTYGGPPSFFYTLLEVLARFERWMEQGLITAGASELAEFDGAYGLNASSLGLAYRLYRHQRQDRHHQLMKQRSLLLRGWERSGFSVLAPRYSINAAVFYPGHDDSYVAFRDLMRTHNISTYPGILNFCFDQALLRVTSSRPWFELEQSMKRLGVTPA
jgi:aspartate/methionine/tyrosine aminotransferase